MPSPEAYIFGLADITIGEGEDVIQFDGREYLQAEGGELVLTPLWTDLTFADFGETVVERRITGWEGSLTIVTGQETAEMLDLALNAVEPITETAGGTEVGVMDGRIGTRAKGRKVRIHPRSLPESDTSKDFVIYNMASIEGMTRTYGAEQGSMTITLNMLPREGFDASEPGNFFYRGSVDPHADTAI